MAYSTDIDYSNTLSLEKAVLKNRKRLNYLGSKELVLDYNGVTSQSREDCMEWLEANRLSITDPSFGFRTYEGTWVCINISYIEEKSILRQTFKIDSALTDDVALKTSAGVEAYRTYHFRVADPTAYNVPDTVEAGYVYSKRIHDNGDGTYDVIIDKVTDKAKTGNSSSEYGLWSETSTTTLNDTEQALPAWTAGTIVSVDNVPLDNGKFRSTVTVRTAKKAVITKRYPSDYVDPTQYPQITVAKNHTEAEIDALIGDMSNLFVNNLTMSLNEYGLYDAVITSRYD